MKLRRIYKKPEVRFQTPALLALQEASEAYLVSMFETADKCRIHAGRETVIDADLELARLPRIKSVSQEYLKFSC